MTAGFLTSLAQRRATNLLLSVLLVSSVLAPRVGLTLGMMLGGESFSVVLCTGSGLVRVAVDIDGVPADGLTTAVSTAGERIGSPSDEGAVAFIDDSPGAAMHCAPGATPLPALGRHLAIVGHVSALAVGVAEPAHPHATVPRFIQPAGRAPPHSA